MYCYAIKTEGQNLLILVINWPILHLNYILDFFLTDWTNFYAI